MQSAVSALQCKLQSFRPNGTLSIQKQGGDGEYARDLAQAAQALGEGLPPIQGMSPIDRTLDSGQLLGCCFLKP